MELSRDLNTWPKEILDTWPQIILDTWDEKLWKNILRNQYGSSSAQLWQCMIERCSDTFPKYQVEEAIDKPRKFIDLINTYQNQNERRQVLNCLIYTHHTITKIIGESYALISSRSKPVSQIIHAPMSMTFTPSSNVGTEKLSADFVTGINANLIDFLTSQTETYTLKEFIDKLSPDKYPFLYKLVQAAKQC